MNAQISMAYVLMEEAEFMVRVIQNMERKRALDDYLLKESGYWNGLAPKRKREYERLVAREKNSYIAQLRIEQAGG